MLAFGRISEKAEVNKRTYEYKHTRFLIRCNLKKKMEICTPFAYIYMVYESTVDKFGGTR